MLNVPCWGEDRMYEIDNKESPTRQPTGLRHNLGPMTVARAYQNGSLSYWARQYLGSGSIHRSGKGVVGMVRRPVCFNEDSARAKLKGRKERSSSTHSAPYLVANASPPCSRNPSRSIDFCLASDTMPSGMRRSHSNYGSASSVALTCSKVTFLWN